MADQAIPLDQRALRCASAALDDLPKRSRDVLRHVLLDGGSAQTIADRNMIERDRANEWLSDARQRFRDRFELQLRRASIHEDDVRVLVGNEARVDQIARDALLLLLPTEHPRPEPPDERIGTTVGQYKLLGLLGTGGMGAVYSAEHVTLGEAAVKLIRADWASSPEVIARLEREAKAARRVAGPGVVTVYEVGSDGGVPFIAMELLRGESVGARQRARGRLATAEAVRICRQTAAVLVKTHHAGVAHRDLKPDNLFLVEDPEVPGGERVKVLDFGLAKLEERSDDPRLTLFRTPMGSPAYMAPEQCIDPRKTDARADVYSLGCTLFDLLAGRPPFTGTREHVMDAHVVEAAPSIHDLAPDVPVTLGRLIRDMLEKSPEDRVAIATAFEKLLTVERELSTTGSATKTTRVSRRGWLLPIASACVIGVLGILILVNVGERREETAQGAAHRGSGTDAQIPPSAEGRAFNEAGSSAVVASPTRVIVAGGSNDPAARTLPVVPAIADGSNAASLEKGPAKVTAAPRNRVVVGTQPSTTDAGTQPSTTDAGTRPSTTDAGTQSSTTDGGTQTSTTDDEIVTPVEKPTLGTWSNRTRRPPEGDTHRAFVELRSSKELLITHTNHYPAQWNGQNTIETTTVFHFRVNPALLDERRFVVKKMGSDFYIQLWGVNGSRPMEYLVEGAHPHWVNNGSVNDLFFDDVEVARQALRQLKEIVLWSRAHQ